MQGHVVKVSLCLYAGAKAHDCKIVYHAGRRVWRLPLSSWTDPKRFQWNGASTGQLIIVSCVQGSWFGIILTRWQRQGGCGWSRSMVYSTICHGTRRTLCLWNRYSDEIQSFEPEAYRAQSILRSRWRICEWFLERDCREG
jgi:hypothetical protein